MTTQSTTAGCIEWLDAAAKSPLLTPRVASLIASLRTKLLAFEDMKNLLIQLKTAQDEFRGGYVEDLIKKIPAILEKAGV